LSFDIEEAKVKSLYKRRLAGLALLILAALVLFSPGTAGGSLEPPIPTSAQGNSSSEVWSISSLPYTISASGSYYLTDDLTAGGTGITVEASNVTIDLMGRELIGPDSGVSYGIYMNGCRNVEIRNGTVRNFGSHGVYEANANSSKEHRLNGVQAMSNGGKGIFLRGSGHLVQNCVAARNGSDGIDVEYGSTLTGNTAYENQGTGIMAGGGCELTGNVIEDNQGNGIYTSSSCTVISNTTSHNQGSGIHTGWGCTVTGNTSDGNQRNGIYTGSNSPVTENIVDDNLQTGIYGESGCTIVSNTTRRNNRSKGGDHAGIRVFTDCLVKGNTADYNKQNNILVAGSGNSIEDNVATNSTNGIYFKVVGNSYTNNRASKNTTNFAGCVPTGKDDGGGNTGS
jgi:parallel beta-helix repeat protein